MWVIAFYIIDQHSFLPPTGQRCLSAVYCQRKKCNFVWFLATTPIKNRISIPVMDHPGYFIKQSFQRHKSIKNIVKATIKQREMEGIMALRKPHIIDNIFTILCIVSQNKYVYVPQSYMSYKGIWSLSILQGNDNTVKWSAIMSLSILIISILFLKASDETRQRHNYQNYSDGSWWICILWKCSVRLWPVWHLCFRYFMAIFSWNNCVQRMP